MKFIIAIITSAFCFNGWADADVNWGVVENGAVEGSDRSDVTSAITERAPSRKKGFFFDWGQAQNGWGYCYKWASSGAVLNNGQPVPNFRCERVNPSRPRWGQAQNGWGYCYRYTPYGVAMFEGQPIDEYECERVRPSYYDWGRGQDGYTYCYQWTPRGIAMNEGRPVANYFCEY
ncbi:MAG: hypothetical protein AAF203_02665 [Pseudomonadota bacterium]